MEKCPKTDHLIDLVFFPEKLCKDAAAEIREHTKKCLGCRAVVQRYEKELSATKDQK